jgi:hypothetical protein
MFCLSHPAWFYHPNYIQLGRAVAYWLRHYATNRVAGSIPNGVIRIFQWHNPFGRNMSLGTTQPLTGVFSGGKVVRCVRPYLTLPPSRAVVMKSGNLNFLEPSGPLQTCNGADCFTFLHHISLDLNLKKNLMKCYVWKHSFVVCCKVDISGSRPEILWTLWNVALEKEGDDQLDRSCEKWRIT